MGGNRKATTPTSIAVGASIFGFAKKGANRNASATVDMTRQQGSNLALASSRLVGLAGSRDGERPLYRWFERRPGDVAATIGLFD
jgi:hypothetical protein